MQDLPRDRPLWGREFDWLGTDHHGHVAVFTNAGYGPLPETVTERFADVDAALERADELPAIGSAGNIKDSGDGDYSFWYSYSAKGFYAYDWHVWNGPYRRLSSPTVPISIDQFPDHLQAVARLAVFAVTSPTNPRSPATTSLSMAQGSSQPRAGSSLRSGALGRTLTPAFRSVDQ